MGPPYFEFVFLMRTTQTLRCREAAPSCGHLQSQEAASYWVKLVFGKGLEVALGRSSRVFSPISQSDQTRQFRAVPVMSAMPPIATKMGSAANVALCHKRP